MTRIIHLNLMILQCFSTRKRLATKGFVLVMNLHGQQAGVRRLTKQTLGNVEIFALMDCHYQSAELHPN